MNDSIKRHIRKLIEQDGLPDDTLIRAKRFFLLHANGPACLYDIPLGPDERDQIGRLLAHKSLDDQRVAAKPVPTLSSATRLQLRALFDSGSEHAEAALYVLSQDLQARAFNHTLEGKPHSASNPKEPPHGQTSTS